MAETVAFYLLAGLAVVASALVIGQRNPMYSVLLLIASFGALSGLYVQLDAPFVAVAQIIIYAGAIMVLFLFVVMLLNAPQEDAADWDRTHPLRKPRHRAFGALLAVLLVVQLVWALMRIARAGGPGRAQSRRRDDQLGAELGRVLFERHGFAFEATSILILVAMVGAVVLAQQGRDRRRDSAQPLPDRLGDAVRDRHGRRVPAPQPDHDPAVDRDHAERGEPDVRRLRPLSPATSTGRSSRSS